MRRYPPNYPVPRDLGARSDKATSGQNISNQTSRTFFPNDVSVLGCSVHDNHGWFAFIAAGVMRLELLQEAHKDIFPIALGITLVALGALSIASYLVVRAIEWASRREATSVRRSRAQV